MKYLFTQNFEPLIFTKYIKIAELFESKVNVLAKREIDHIRRGSVMMTGIQTA
jgi:hypothetical protein